MVTAQVTPLRMAKAGDVELEQLRKDVLLLEIEKLRLELRLRKARETSGMILPMMLKGAAFMAALIVLMGGLLALVVVLVMAWKARHG